MLVLLLTVFHQALPLDLIDLNSMTGMRLNASQGPRFCPGRSPLRDVQLPKLMQQLAPTFEAALCDAILAMMLLAHPGRRYLHGALERHLAIKRHDRAAGAGIRKYGQSAGAADGERVPRTCWSRLLTPLSALWSMKIFF